MNLQSNLTPQLVESFHWRYATKVFDPTRKISSENWAALEESMIFAPSAYGLQPYRILVIDDKATREKLVPHAWGQRQVVDASHFVVFAVKTSLSEVEIDAHIRRVASTRGVAVESLAGYRGMMTGNLLTETFRPNVPHWTARQAYLVLGELLASAALLGVDTCPIEGFVPAEFNRILGLTEQGLSAAVCCALGYRSTADKYASVAKVRLPKQELLKTI